MDAIRGASPRSSNPSTAERFPAQDANQNSDVGTKPRQGGAIAPPSASRSMAPPANGSSIAAPQSGNSNVPANGSSIAAPQTPASNAPSTGSKIAPPQARSQDASQSGSDDALQGRVDGNKLPAERASDSDTPRQGGVGENTPPSQGSSDPDDTFQGRINGNALPPERTTPEGVIAPEEPDTTTATDDAADVEAAGPFASPEEIDATLIDVSVNITPAPVDSDVDLSNLTTGELGELTASAAEQIGRGSALGDVAAIEEGLVTLANVRQQLRNDGARATDFIGLIGNNVDFNDAVVDYAREIAYDISGDPRADEENLQLTGDALRNATPTAFEISDFARTRRVAPVSSLPPEIAQDVATAIDGAISNDGQAELSGSNRQLANLTELRETILAAAEEIVSGVINDDAAQIQQGQDIFGFARSVLTDLGFASEADIEALNNSFGTFIESSAEENISDVPEGFTQPVLDALNEDIDDAYLTDTPFVDSIRVKDVTSFEGTNGEPPVSIVSIDHVETSSLASPGHQTAIENVIESQLQDAGQGYELTNLEIANEAGAVGRVLNEVAAIAPDFATISLSTDITPDEVDSILRALDVARNDPANDPALFEPFEGFDLTLDASPQNFDDFAPVIREVIANFETYAPFVPISITDLNRWAEALTGAENIAQAGVTFTASARNSNTDFNPIMFASDEGAPGSITSVAGITSLNALETNEFFFDPADIPNDTPAEDEYRGGGAEVFAPGTVPSGLRGTVNGASFATPETLVNIILGRIDPKAI